MALRIREIRTRKAITQETLAQKVNITREYLSAVENGRKTPSLTLLEKLACALEVNLGELLSSDIKKF